MNNRGLLIVIVILLVGILAIFVVDRQDRARTPGEKIADSINEVTEEIGDEIDDHTTSR